MMKNKGKVKDTSFWTHTYGLPLPLLLLICLICFLIGFYGSTSFNEDSSPIKVSLIQQHVEKTEDTEVLPIEHGTTGDSSIRSIPFQVLSWAPRIILFPNFASKEQCETIMELARPRLKPSSVALRLKDTAEKVKERRKSLGTFLNSHEDKSGILKWVEEKMAQASFIPIAYGEPFNVLKYEVGQKYDAHYDYFDPTEYGPKDSQRVASFLLYLSDVEAGGETMFPFENYQNMNSGYDYKQCIGFKVKPRQGDALLFYSILHNGTIDKISLHGSCEVIKGEKWVATKWLRDKIQRYSSS